MHAAAHRLCSPPATSPASFDPAAHESAAQIEGDARPNRRRCGRLRCRNVMCRFAGEVEDISASGVRLRLERPPPVATGQRLALVLTGPAGSMELKGRIAWSRDAGRGYEVGVDFGALSAQARRALFTLAWGGPDDAGPMRTLSMSPSAA